MEYDKIPNLLSKPTYDFQAYLALKINLNPLQMPKKNVILKGGFFN
jgi:hypothetical protein